MTVWRSYVCNLQYPTISCVQRKCYQIKGIGTQRLAALDYLISIAVFLLLLLHTLRAHQIDSKSDWKSNTIMQAARITACSLTMRLASS